MPKLYHNGQLASTDSPALRPVGILVGDDGRIERVAEKLDPGELPGGAETVDCSGCVLLPGLFDLHVHSRDPGHDHRETLQTCAAAALHGGITGLVMMPDTEPPIDSGTLVKSVLDRVAALEEANPSATPRMLQSGCLTRRREGSEMAGYSGMARQGVPMVTDSGASVPCPDLMRRAMQFARDFGLLVTVHCDTPSLNRGGALNEGTVSYRLGLPGNPAAAQELAIARDLCLSRHTGARLHIQQISTADGLRAVARAKDDGIPVSCEVSPHHLLLTEEDIGDYDTRSKFDPPLRTEADRRALVEGLRDGTIDAIASDHSPHTGFEKSADFGAAPAGATGLETALPVLHDRFIREGVFGWDLLVRCYSDTPRRLVGQEPVRIAEGEPADFVVFDPEAETTFDRGFFLSKSPVTPFEGKTVQGTVRETVIAGSAPRSP